MAIRYSNDVSSMEMLERGITDLMLLSTIMIPKHLGRKIRVNDFVDSTNSARVT